MEEQIATFQKNASEDVIVKLTEYRGVEGVDIRAYIKPLINREEPQATRKGIFLRIEFIPELLKALEEAIKKPVGYWSTKSHEKQGQMGNEAHFSRGFGMDSQNNENNYPTFRPKV